MANSQDPSLTVFYDGACPLCDREIAFYRSRRGAERVSWVDLTASTHETIAPGLSRQAALARFHLHGYQGWWEDGANPAVAAYYASVKARPSWLAAEVTDTGNERNI